MLGGGGFGPNQNQQSSGGLFGTSGSFGVGQQTVTLNNINSSIQQSGPFSSSTPLFSGGNLGSGLFGNANVSGTGFGSTGSSSSFGQSSNGLFGQSMGAFGSNQQIGSAQHNIFGSSNGASTGIFGSGTGSCSGIFGSFGNSFGSTTGFGNQSSQQTNSNSFFNQQANAGIFGNSSVQGFGNVSSSPFGTTLGTSSNIFGSKKGTNGITFQPLVDRDSDARIMSIVYQKDIDQKKSVEELRWEDYQEKRGPSNSLSKPDIGLQTNTNTFGTFSNSGFFGSGSQNSAISNSVFGQSQNYPFTSSNPQSSVFSGNSLTMSQPVLGQGAQPGQQTLTSSQFGGSNTNLFGSSPASTNPFPLQTSSSSNTGLFSSSNNNSGLFGQTGSGIFENTFKTQGNLFGGSTVVPNSNMNLFGATNSNQQQISLGGNSIGNKSLFGTTQPVTNSGIGGSILSGTSELSSTSNIIGSTKLVSNNLLNNTNSGSLLFGSSSISQSSNSSSIPLIMGSNLFGSSSGISQTLNTGNTGSSNSIWPNAGSSQNSLNFTTGNSTVGDISSNNFQYQGILGNGSNNIGSNSQSSISVGTGLSNSNLLSSSNIMKPISQNSLKYSDSTDRGKALWLWKPLPQYISRPSRYKLDSSAQVNVADRSASNSELALPALATESARQNTILLSSVRRVEKTVDLQTPATFLSLLERQHFFDAMQSPDSSSTSPVNTRIRSMIFSKPHESHPKSSSIDETFEDAIDDSNPNFSPKINTTDGRLSSECAKSLLNLESISRISQNIQFSKKTETRNSMGRTSIESNNTSRTPHSNKQRTSIGSVTANGDRPQARTSIGLTTPRPILRKFDHLNGNNLVSEFINSNKFQREHIVGSLVPVLTKPDYLCIPSIEVLRTFSEDRLAVVEDFRIIREGIGEIMWPGVTDLRGINLDLVVSIEPLCVSVYGDDDSPVPIGEGLNKKALVTLKNCKPKKILSLADANEIETYKNNRVNQIKIYTEQMGARFISLDTNTWEWKFEVSHFSRYGLVSDDVSMESSNHQFEQSSLATDLRPMANKKLPTSNYNKLGSGFVQMVRHNKLNGFYSETISLLNRHQFKERGNIYNNLSFRSGVYIGSYGLVVLPHKSSCVSSKNFYNTSITLFKIKKSQPSIVNSQDKIFGLPRRIISIWLRMYIEIVGNPVDVCNLKLESILKLSFLMWEVVKKELIFVSSNQLEKSDSTRSSLKYCEETLCFLTGMLEILVRNETKMSRMNIESRVSEYLSWWIRFVCDKGVSTKIKNLGIKREIEPSSIDNTISRLCSYLRDGNIGNLISSKSVEEFLNIPRTTSLCLSIGTNKSSIYQFKKNFQWWVAVGICSDLSSAAFKLYKSVTSIDLISNSSYNWPVFFFNNSTKARDMFKHETNNGDMVNRNSKINSFVKNDDSHNYNKYYRHELFDMQLQMINFFTAKNKNMSIDSLECLYRSNSCITFDLSFCWFVTRILTLCHGIIYKDKHMLFSHPKLHLLFISELELLGMWEWAAYISIHIDSQNKQHSSANVFNSIITRNIDEISHFLYLDEYIMSNKWNFLVNTVGIPLTWLMEALIYKSNTNSNTVQSIKFIIYLIDHIRNREYKSGDLFFQHKSLSLTQVINNLIFLAFVKLFDAQFLPRTLVEISAVVWNEANGEEDHKSGGCFSRPTDVNQFTELEKLYFLINTTKENLPIAEDIWKIMRLILSASYKFILCSIQRFRGESLHTENSSVVYSLVKEIVVSRMNENLNSIEFPIMGIVCNNCWEIILNTLETVG